MVTIQCSEANFALLDHATAYKMRPPFDLFKNFRYIFPDDADSKKVHGTEKEHNQQQGGYASRRQLGKKQFGEELCTHEDAGDDE